MSEIGPIHQSHPALGRIAAQRAGRAADAAQTQARGNDQVELSTHAQLLSQVNDAVRPELVAQARQRIESGYYESQQVIDQTIDRLAEDLFA